MSEYYRGKRTRNIYSPIDEKPFKLSRSKIDLFLECPKCFYIDRRLGLGRPPGFPFALNSAVDSMLKKEFDALREKGGSHPLLEQFGVDAKPAPHDMIDEWPWVPGFVEIEASNEKKLKDSAETLGLDYEKALHGSVEIVYQKYFDVTEQEVDDWKEIIFKDTPNWLEKKRKK